MLKALNNVPTFEEGLFRRRSAGWKALLGAGPGLNRVVVEWGVIKGPSVFVYPAADRTKGVNLTEGFHRTQSDERWADFLEYDYVPRVVNFLKAEGFPVQVNCVDLRPVQTQRARRRAIEAAAHAKSGHTDTSLAGIDAALQNE